MTRGGPRRTGRARDRERGGGTWRGDHASGASGTGPEDRGAREDGTGIAPRPAPAINIRRA